MGRMDLFWVTCAGGLAACGGSPPMEDAATDAWTADDAINDVGIAERDVGRADAGAGSDGTWQRCCPGDLAIPGIQSRGSGDSLQCFCPAGVVCNYGQCFWFDAGMDAGASEDTGFADAGPIEDAAIDALVITDDSGPMDDASIDAFADAAATP